MKVCFRCKTEKDETEFYRRSRNKNTLYPWCKKCVVRYTNDHHIRKKARAVQYLGGKCADCGLVMNDENPYYLFDFHHVDPSKKEFCWGKRRFSAWERITKELDKCVCLCALCHRRREYHEGRLIE